MKLDHAILLFDNQKLATCIVFCFPRTVIRSAVTAELCNLYNCFSIHSIRDFSINIYVLVLCKRCSVKPHRPHQMI